MAKRSSSSMDQFVVRSDSGTATSDQGFSSDASSSAADNRKPASAAAAAGKKQRLEPGMAMPAAAGSGALSPPFHIFTQQSPVADAAASAAPLITPEEQRLMRTTVVCTQKTHNKKNGGTSVPLDDCKIMLSKLSGLPSVAKVIDHVRRIGQLPNQQIPLRATCDKHRKQKAAEQKPHHAKTSAKLVATKRAAAEAVPLTGGLDRLLEAPEIIAKRNELSGQGTLLHSLINGVALPGTDTVPTKPVPFNINLGLARRYGGKGPDGELLPGLDPKDCKEVEAFAFTTTRANYRGRVTDPGRDSVLRATKYFKTKVIYVSRRRFNAGEVERALLKMCIDDLRLRHLINQNRGGYKTSDDAEWQAVSITYLDLTVPGAEDLVIHMDGKKIGA